MPLLKRRLTLANWLLIIAFAGGAGFLFQHAREILGNFLGLLMVSAYALVFLLPFLTVWLCIWLLVITPFAVLLLGLVLIRRQRRKPEIYQLYSHRPKPIIQQQDKPLPLTQRQFKY